MLLTLEMRGRFVPFIHLIDPGFTLVAVTKLKVLLAVFFSRGCRTKTSFLIIMIHFNNALS